MPAAVTADRPPVALVVLAVALLVWPSTARLAAERVRGLVDGRRPAVAPEGRRLLTVGRLDGPVRRRRLLAAIVGVAVAALLGGGPTGLAAASVVAFAVDRLLAKSADDQRLARGTSRALEDELPGACELLAVCLTAGVPVGAALAGVGASVTGPLGAELSAVAVLLRLGAEPRKAWLAAPPEMAALGRVLVRAGESGSTVTAALRALADEGRGAARARTEAAVHRAGVWVLAPLGLCFLPAFLCLGVLPLVLGIADNVFR
jgi:pilus assembly protein TadC